MQNAMTMERGVTFAKHLASFSKQFEKVKTHISKALVKLSKTIKGYEVLNIKTEFKNKITNVFYGFKVQGNTLIISEVNKKLINKEFKSKTELLDFFKKNINKKDFFINRTELIRKSI